MLYTCCQIKWNLEWHKQFLKIILWHMFVCFLALKIRNSLIKSIVKVDVNKYFFCFFKRAFNFIIFNFFKFIIWYFVASLN